MRDSNRGAVELSKFFRQIQEGADLVGVGSPVFSLLLSGKRKPSIEVAAKIEHHFGVPCRYWTESVVIYDKVAKDSKGED